MREVNYIYAIPCPTGPLKVPRSGSSFIFFSSPGIFSRPKKVNVRSLDLERNQGRKF